jgi:hypothetical protein
VELQPWWEHLCPVPAIVVRMLGEDGDWRTSLHPAGVPAALPLMIGRRHLMTIELDPAALVGRRASTPAGGHQYRAPDPVAADQYRAPDPVAATQA